MRGGRSAGSCQDACPACGALPPSKASVINPHRRRTAQRPGGREPAGKRPQRLFTTRVEQEIAGYADVLETVFNAHDANPLAKNHGRQLHRDLLAHSDRDERHRGSCKTHANRVEACDEEGESRGLVFETATLFGMPGLMDELVARMAGQEEDGNSHPLLVIAIFVAVLLEIHALRDGNGRLSRILTTLLPLRGRSRLCALQFA